MLTLQGTAVVVVPVGSVTYKGQKIVYQVRSLMQLTATPAVRSQCRVR